MDDDNNIGNDLNIWRKPVFTLAADEGWLERTILSHERIKNINLPSKQWTGHCWRADTVIDKILCGIKKYAQLYEGLIIHHYVNQGSSREGLKVNDALEFDCLLIFEICDMMNQECHVFDKDGEKILGLVKVEVTNGEFLCQTYPWLHSMRILEKPGYPTDTFYFNTKNLQEYVFKSIIDKTRSEINDQLPVGYESFALRRSAYPPTFNIKITVDKELSFVHELYSPVQLQSSAVNESLQILELNIDIVPAIIIRRDLVPDPYTVRSPTGVSLLECPVFAVMKWANKICESSITGDYEYLWRESACGYEKHILDVSRRNPSQRYLMTACRIVKSYVGWLKENKAQEDQLHRVAVSYYMKNICFHCIALLTIPSETNSLSGVQEALGYFLCFLGLCIENRNLPHFFYGNPLLGVLFPICSFSSIGKTKNLYDTDTIKHDTFLQAERGFKSMLHDLKGCYTQFDQLKSSRVGLFKELLGLKYIYVHERSMRVWQRTTFC